MIRIGRYEFRPGLIPTLAFLLVFPALLSLGFWQLDRAEEKRGIEREVEAATERDPLMLNTAKHSKLRDEIYRSARMRGTYDGKRQYLWDNKTHNGVAGYQVLTPFLLDSSDAAVIVNRGWVPWKERRDNIPNIDTPDEQLLVRGRIRSPSNAIQLANHRDQQNAAYPRVVQAFEPSLLAAELGVPVLPVMIELGTEEQYGFVRDWKPYFGSVGKHIGYAIQWFLMALIVFGLYIKMNLQRSADDRTAL